MAEKSVGEDESGADRQVVVEAPRGSRNKYKLDEKTGRMMLSKLMPEGMVFPFDFGFFPGTRSEDGDPLDVMVLHDEPTFPGCQIGCRLIGVIEAMQRDKGEEKRNDRVLAVARSSMIYAEVNELEDLPAGVLKHLDEFFVNYQKVREIDFRVLGHGDAAKARDLVRRSSDGTP